MTCRYARRRISSPGDEARRVAANVAKLPEPDRGLMSALAGPIASAGL
jgi:hypothetical protein